MPTGKHGVYHLDVSFKREVGERSIWRRHGDTEHFQQKLDRHWEVDDVEFKELVALLNKGTHFDRLLAALKDIADAIYVDDGPHMQRLAVAAIDNTEGKDANSAWRLIETAPRGAKYIYIAAREQAIIGYFSEISKRWETLDEPRTVIREPTQWQPLPEAPSS